MDSKKIIYTVIGVPVLLFILYGIYLLSGNSPNKPQPANKIILYWGIGCPHCEKVEEYLKSHPEIEKKIKIERKEVYKDNKNAFDLQEKAESCGQDTSSGVPVPFLYYKGECIIGDKPVIDYLTKKAS